MPRAPFQVLVLPYTRATDGTPQYAVFRRADLRVWQGLAGGRLIVGPVSGADVAATVEAFAAAGVRGPAVLDATDRTRKTRAVVWAGADAGA